MRAALYWAPEVGDPLAVAGNAWLGRDPETGAMLAQPAIPGLTALTADARVYGFHATLRPPMRLAGRWEAFREAAAELAARTAPFDLPTLELASLDGFLALVPAAPCPALHALANACVAATEPHRYPADEAELAKRRAAGLSAVEEAMLLRWGYPYVMQTWRFHITLSRRLSPAEIAGLHPAAAAHFAAALGMRRRVTELCVFTQAPASGSELPPLLVAERLVLGGGGSA